MIIYSAIKAYFQKYVYAISMISEEKNLSTKSAALPIELFVLWFLMEYCSSFLHFFVFNPLQNES